MMGFLETALLVDLELKPIFWHEPTGRSSVYLPDSRELWDAIWENRERLLGIAHTHPFNGLPTPSQEDLSTFRAVDLALGKGLCWWIVTFDEIQEYRQVEWIGGHRLYATSELAVRRMTQDAMYSFDWMPESFVARNEGKEPDWVQELRERSLV